MIYHDISHNYITSNPKKDMERVADVYDLGVSPWGPKLTGQPPASAEIGRWLSWGKELPHSVSVNVSELLCFLSVWLCLGYLDFFLTVSPVDLKTQLEWIMQILKLRFLNNSETVLVMKHVKAWCCRQHASSWSCCTTVGPCACKPPSPSQKHTVTYKYLNTLNIRYLKSKNDQSGAKISFSLVVTTRHSSLSH